MGPMGRQITVMPTSLRRVGSLNPVRRAVQKSRHTSRNRSRSSTARQSRFWLSSHSNRSVFGSSGLFRFREPPSSPFATSLIIEKPPYAARLKPKPEKRGTPAFAKLGRAHLGYCGVIEVFLSDQPVIREICWMLFSMSLRFGLSESLKTSTISWTMPSRIRWTSSIPLRVIWTMTLRRSSEAWRRCT